MRIYTAKTGYSLDTGEFPALSSALTTSEWKEGCRRAVIINTVCKF